MMISRCSRTSLSGHRRLNGLESECSFPSAGTKFGIIDESRLALPCRIEEFFDSAVESARFLQCSWIKCKGSGVMKYTQGVVDRQGLQKVLQWYNERRPFSGSPCHDDQEAQ